MNVKKVVAFVSLTFLVSYSVVPLYFAFGGNAGDVDSEFNATAGLAILVVKG